MAGSSLMPVVGFVPLSSTIPRQYGTVGEWSAPTTRTLAPASVPPGWVTSSSSSSSSSSSTALGVFGSDGVFGVGAPEVVVITLVGYFILGPTELYKLVKQVGKFVQNIRTLGAEASKGFEDSMEEQLQLTEFRKAQRELNDVFNFRRSINYNDLEEEEEAAVTAAGVAAAGASTATAAASSSSSLDKDATSTKKKKKKILRRVKKKVAPPPPPTLADGEAGAVATDIPQDLDMPPPPPPKDAAVTEAEAERLRNERMARLADSGELDWFTGNMGPENANDADVDAAFNVEEQSRFAAQLSDDWNRRIMENEDALGPLATIMERIAILEEEKNAANARLEEEFRVRAELEQDYYQKKRTLLNEAARQVQLDTTTSSPPPPVDSNNAQQQPQQEQQL